MKDIKITDKQKYLAEHFHIEEVPEVMDKRKCLHCDSIFFVGDYKVFEDEDGEEWIYCPNAPDCDGTIIDWMPIE